MSLLKRRLRLYKAFSVITAKQFLAYSLWVWVQLCVQVLMMTVFVFFWQAVYTGRTAVGGLTQTETLTYILLAQMLSPLVEWGLIMRFGEMIGNGSISIELLRPIDLQERFFVEELSGTLINLVQQIFTIGIVAVVFFDLRLTTDLTVWAAFILTLVFGRSILFFFDWMVACVAFYSTEIWGLHVVRAGIALFFSGALIPLAMLPEWLQSLAALLPFSQTIYVPAGLLSGIIPLAQLGQIVLIQVLWLVGLFLASRWVFSLAIKKVTVQGG